MKPWILIDAGTTNVRVSLLDGEGRLLSSAHSDAGVRCTAIDGHNGRLCAALREGVAQVLREADIAPEAIDRCVAYGMITSNMGLCEIPHLVAPASPAVFRARLVTRSFPDIAPFPITFVPGLRNFAGRVTLDNVADMDMMRGEETEAIGLWAALQPQSDCMIVLPGSHNKFIAMRADGTLQGCMTSISGELLDALTHHTVLASTVADGFAAAEDYNPDMMLAGARACDAGLGRAAFTTRILGTLGDISVADARSFLLGAVLRLDWEALTHFSLYHPGQMLLIAGKPPLSAALRDLCHAQDVQAQIVPEDVRSRMGVLGAMTLCGEG